MLSQDVLQAKKLYFFTLNSPFDQYSNIGDQLTILYKKCMNVPSNIYITYEILIPAGLLVLVWPSFAQVTVTQELFLCRHQMLILLYEIQFFLDIWDIVAAVSSILQCRIHKTYESNSKQMAKFKMRQKSTNSHRKINNYSNNFKINH